MGWDGVDGMRRIEIYGRLCPDMTKLLMLILMDIHTAHFVHC